MMGRFSTAPVSLCVAFFGAGWADAEPACTDVPFRQARAVICRNEIDLTQYELRGVQADRDGRVLVNTNRGLLKAFDGRLVQYREMAGLENRDHLDLELHRGKFVFLTDKMLLPLHRAGAEYLDNAISHYTRVAFAPDRCLLLSPATVAEARAGKTKSQPNPGYREVLFDPAGNDFVLFATDRLARYDGGRLVALPAPPAAIRGVAADARGRLQVATSDGLFEIAEGSVRADPAPLPVRDLTAIAKDSTGRLWVGSARGVVGIEADGSRRYYAGRRWLPDDRVVDLAAGPDDNLHVLTRGGLSSLIFDRTTLADKAEVLLRNLRRHHIRYGLVSDARLIDGDYATLRMYDSDNDGLWSAMYLASEAYRWAVTRRPDAYENVMDGLDALERLVTISGIPGFQARTFELEGFKVSDPERWRTRPGHDFEWKGHTSSDEIVGTMFFYSVFDETVAKEDPALHKRVGSIVASIVDHILDHRLYLVDVDGRPTLWGRWNPEYVNTNEVGGDRRLNSIEILSFLQLAHALTGAPRYREAFEELVNRHGYADNVVHHLPDPMGEWNHSDDELYWLSYYNLLRHCFDERLKPVFLQSANEHAKATARKHNPVWNFIYGHATGRPIDPEPCVSVLREFPLDQRRWAMRNSHRLDIRIDRRPRCEPESATLLSPAERSVSKWNGNEMALDGGGDPNEVESGAEYLLPYWMGRYAGYISPPRHD
jgi:hypothetical protein